jgi:murein tripeptide amidase MpaA
VLEGFLTALLSNKLEAEELRRNFIFKVVPMVNIDGVILGNYRTNLSGNDLNRKWDNPNRELHP